MPFQLHTHIPEQTALLFQATRHKLQGAFYHQPTLQFLCYHLLIKTQIDCYSGQLRVLGVVRQVFEKCVIEWSSGLHGLGCFDVSSLAPLG